MNNIMGLAFTLYGFGTPNKIPKMGKLGDFIHEATQSAIARNRIASLV